MVCACSADTLLKKAVKMVEVKFEQGMQRAKQGVSLGYDSWTDVSHNQLMALSVTTTEQPRKVLHTSAGHLNDHSVYLLLYFSSKLLSVSQHVQLQIYTHKTINITSSPKTGEKTYLHLKEEIEHLEVTYKVEVIAVVSDAAGEAAKARRLLSAWKPSLISIDCYSHQFNLSVGGMVHWHGCDCCNAVLQHSILSHNRDKGQVLVVADYLNSKKTDHRYLKVVADAIDLSAWWIRHSVPHGMLEAKQLQVLGKTVALSLPVVTRWGSHYTAFKQLLANHRPMQFLVLEKREELLNSVGKKKAPQDAAKRMLDLTTDSSFWTSLELVMKHLGPLLVGPDCLQCCHTSVTYALLPCVIQQPMGELQVAVFEIYLQPDLCRRLL